MKKIKKIIAVALTCLTTLSLMLTTSCSFKNPKQLFCKHEYTEEVTKKATCTEDGEKMLTCSKCDYVKTKVIESAGHSIVEDEAVSATCVENGKTLGKRCAVCGVVIKEQELIPATGHSLETITGKTPTCGEDGLSDGVICTVCDEIVVAQEVLNKLENHNVKDGICTVCGSSDYSFVENNAYYATNITTGDTYKSGWVRLYRNSLVADPMILGLKIEFKVKDESAYHTIDRIATLLIAPDSKNSDSNNTAVYIDGEFAVSYTDVVISNLEYKNTEDYVDVFLPQKISVSYVTTRSRNVGDDEWEEFPVYVTGEINENAIITIGSRVETLGAYYLKDLDVNNVTDVEVGDSTLNNTFIFYKNTKDGTLKFSCNNITTGECDEETGVILQFYENTEYALCLSRWLVPSEVETFSVWVLETEEYLIITIPKLNIDDGEISNNSTVLSVSGNVKKLI